MAFSLHCLDFSCFTQMGYTYLDFSFAYAWRLFLLAHRAIISSSSLFSMLGFFMFILLFSEGVLFSHGLLVVVLDNSLAWTDRVSWDWGYDIPFAVIILICSCARQLRV